MQKIFKSAYFVEHKSLLEPIEVTLAIYLPLLASFNRGFRRYTCVTLEKIFNYFPRNIDNPFAIDSLI